MLRQSIQVFVRFSFVVSCTVLSVTSSLCGEVQPYQSYTAPEGTHYIALGLQVDKQPAALPAEVVFLVDTSAGQVGQARLDTLEVIVSAINHLPEGTKIQILAMDVETEPLTDQFYDKGSPELETALKTLYRRVPLGATDFGKGLEAARKTFETGSDNAPRSVLYLGGGRSMAKTISADVFEQESYAFTDQKIPFTACAVGLRTNFGFISAFANRTGGNLIDTAPELKVDAVNETKVDIGLAKADWKKIGQQVADSATATVIWIDPISVDFPEDWSVYPVQMQPIRSDRATILVGTAESETLPVFDLELNGETAVGSIALSFVMIPEAAKSSNNYLRTVVETASRDGGAVMPTVGWNSLLNIQEAFITGIEDQISKADMAMTMGNWQQAMTILSDVLRADPSNKIAQNMFQTAEEQQMNGNILSNTLSQDEDSFVEEGNAVRMSPATSFVDVMTREQSLGVQKIQEEVTVAIANAQKRISVNEPDYDGAAQELKLMQQMIRNNTSLAPASRDALVDRLGNTLKRVEQKRIESEFRTVQEVKTFAEQRSRMETLRTAQENREKGSQIFERFKALMEEGEFAPAVAVADVAMEVIPDSSAPFYARRMAQMEGYIEEYAVIRYKRHIGFLETFMDAERSFIPIPAEPPITYIDRERWKLLSDYRKERYSSIALSDPDESIKTIKAILENRDIRLTIDETTTFSDLFSMIKSELRRLKLPDINIDLDMKALQNSGEYRSDTIVATEGFDHPRMRLRSVLSRLLSPLSLTYIIRDETLLITTVEESTKRDNMFIKVYPIRDIYMLEMGAMGGGG
ncbi:MAG: hypothetical protein LBI05_03345, partial [Planctomycetaceae bacterium]|nr:hypothetical protein [Planctomycetaceae bacterium]